MHIADDLVILEPVDTQGDVVPYGQPADRVLLTNLYNLDQPLIRYDIADAMTMTDVPCPCGCAHRRITDVRGRMDGVFELRGGLAVPRREFETVFLAAPGVADFFVGQADRGVDVSMVTDGSCDSERLRGELIDLLARYGIAAPEVHVREVGVPERLWSGKVQAVRALMTELMFRSAGIFDRPTAAWTFLWAAHDQETIVQCRR